MGYDEQRIHVSIRDKEEDDLTLENIIQQIKKLDRLIEKSKARIKRYERLISKERSISDEHVAFSKKALSFFKLIPK